MNIKLKREALGMTQAELAEALGITRNALALMERGERPVVKRTELAIECLVMKADQWKHLSG